MSMYAGFAAPQTLDARVRERLALSLEHIAERGGEQLGLDPERVAAAIARIRARRQNPAVFVLYYSAVLAIAADEIDKAAHFLERLTIYAEESPSFAIVPFAREALGEEYDLYPPLLFGEYSGVNPTQPPTATGFARASGMLGEAIDIIGRVDPSIHDEITGLILRIVAAAPRRDGSVYGFGGVTSFMAWGATFVNADLHKSVIDAVNFLVHEITHGLLFGLSVDEPLVLNPPQDGYHSPLRTDPRPMDGIYHATIVCARLNEFGRAWCDSGLLTGAELDQVAVATRDIMGRFHDGVSVIREHGQMTPLGARLLDRSREALAVAA